MCVFPEAQRLDRREGSSDVTVLARWRGAGGVLDFGMFATGGSVTWEILFSLCASKARRCAPKSENAVKEEADTKWVWVATWHSREALPSRRPAAQ